MKRGSQGGEQAEQASGVVRRATPRIASIRPNEVVYYIMHYAFCVAPKPPRACGAKHVPGARPTARDAIRRVSPLSRITISFDVVSPWHVCARRSDRDRQANASFRTLTCDARGIGGSPPYVMVCERMTMLPLSLQSAVGDQQDDDTALRECASHLGRWRWGAVLPSGGDSSPVDRSHRASCAKARSRDDPADVALARS